MRLVKSNFAISSFACSNSFCGAVRFGDGFGFGGGGTGVGTGSGATTGGGSGAEGDCLSTGTSVWVTVLSWGAMTSTGA